MVEMELRNELQSQNSHYQELKQEKERLENTTKKAEEELILSKHLNWLIDKKTL